MTTTAERIKSEVGQYGERFVDWLDKTLAQTNLPDRDEMRRQADQVWGIIAERASDLPSNLVRRLPWYEPPWRRRLRTATGVAAGIGVGAVLMYYYDPAKGEERRSRLMARVNGARPGGAGPSGDGHRRQQSQTSNLSTHTPEG